MNIVTVKSALDLTLSSFFWLVILGGTGCLGGCLTCSPSNGCLTCMPRLFIHLERDGMRQIGVCLASCPKGFFGTRSPEKNDCSSKNTYKFRSINRLNDIILVVK